LDSLSAKISSGRERIQYRDAGEEASFHYSKASINKKQVIYLKVPPTDFI
jgi:hypothetical protein